MHTVLPGRFEDLKAFYFPIWGSMGFDFSLPMETTKSVRWLMVTPKLSNS